MTPSVASAPEIAAASLEAWGGSTMTVLVTQPSTLSRARALLQSGLAEFDAACSRFRPDSELTAVNDAGGRPCTISPVLLAALRASLRAAQLTDGAVDPTMGAALVASGYDRDFGQLTDPSPAHSGGSRRPPSATWRDVRLDARWPTVTVPPGVQLDLGATAKALAADTIAARVARACGGGVLVSLGGDLALAGPAPAGGWVVRIAESHRAGLGEAGQSVVLHQGGLATSSTTVRTWWHCGRRVHHLLNPVTGSPIAPYWRTATVAAASCLDANTASTAALIVRAQAVRWLARAGLPARLVHASGTIACVGNWPSADAGNPAGRWA